MESVNEQWRTIPGHPNYEVSDCGRVRSLPRQIVRINRWGQECAFNWLGGLLTNTLHRTGYLVVKLGNDPRQFRVHQLVAWAFIGPQTDGLVVNHIDGNKQNNSPQNLEYITATANVIHAYRTGLLSNKGSKNGKAVLNDEIVRKIRAFSSSVSARQVAAQLGLKIHNVQQVRAGAWSHVA